MEAKEGADVTIEMEEGAGVATKDGYQRIEDPPSEQQFDMPGLPDRLQKERMRIQKMYKKNKQKLDKWILLDNIFKQIERATVALTMIGAAVMGIVAGVQTSQTMSFISAGLAAFGALKEPLAKLFITEFTTKKRMKYMNVCKVIKECLDGMYLSYIQAYEDGVISVDEIKKYQGLIHAMEVKLFELETEVLID